MKRLHLYVRGAVQGVGFRWYTRDTFREAGAGLTGFVRNLPDGRVEIVAEGTAAGLEKALLKLRNGYLGGNISGIEETEEPYTGKYSDFSIVL